MRSILFLCFSSCKHTKSSSTAKAESSSQEDQNAAAQQQLAQQYIETLADERLDFNVEFEILQTAAKDYQQSSQYNNPQNDSQKILNILAQSIPSLSKDALSVLITQNKFSIFDKAFANMDDYTKESQDILNQTTILLAKNFNYSTPPKLDKQTIITSLNTSEMKIITETHTETQTKTITETSTVVQTNTDTTNDREVKKYDIEKYFVLTTGAFVLL